MIELTVLLGLAALGYGLSRWTQFPAIPFLLAGGLGLGATSVVGDPAFVQDVLFLSVSVLLFVVGTDLLIRAQVGKLDSPCAKDRAMLPVGVIFRNPFTYQ